MMYRIMDNSTSPLDQNVDTYSLADYNEAMRRAVFPVTVLVGVECVTGVVGNILVLTVFTFFYRPSNFRYFVLCLCVTDLLCSLTTIPFEIVSHTFWYTYPSLALCKMKSFLNMFTVCSECLCLFVISIDRYRKVCAPHGWQISERVAMYLCCGLNVVSVILASPVPIFWGLHTEAHYHVNVTLNVTKCEKDQEYLYSDSPVYYTYTILTLISVIVVAMFILYVLVARILLKRTYPVKTPAKKVLYGKQTSVSECRHDKDRFVSEDGDEYFHGIYIGPTNTGKKAYKPAYEEESTTFVPGDDGQTGNTVGDSPERVKQHKQKDKSDNFRSSVRQKTLITIILTIVFMVTIIVYFALLLMITENVLVKLSFSERAVYFFFFRLYFVNHVGNPIVYGILDTQFKKRVKDFLRFITKRCKCGARKELSLALHEQSNAKMVAASASSSE